MTVGDDLSESRRLLPEGSQVTGTISAVRKPGLTGAFVDLPEGMKGFVDVQHLPRTARQWPEPGQQLRFEVLQHRIINALPHRRIQVRLWPLDPRFGYDDATPEIENGWRQAKLRYPIGETVRARVVRATSPNREYWIKFAGDDNSRWSFALLPWDSQRPVDGALGQYRIVQHLDATRRMIVTLVGWLDGPSGCTPG